MVEMNPERRVRKIHTGDWAALYERFRHGEDPEALAEDFNLAPETVKSRCRWIENAFPTVEAIQKLITLRIRLERAEARLAGGEPLEAEREAKAILALIRAARALESWIMETSNSKTPAAPKSEPEVSSDYDDPRAELERRLLRLLDVESKRRGLGGHSGSPEHQNPPDEVGADQSPTE